MTLSAYNLNTQYQRTELSYEAKISAVKNDNLLEDKENLNENEIQSSLAPVIYTSQADLTNTELIRKQILEKVLGGFSLQNSESSLLPSDNIDVNRESYTKDNPYSNPYKSMPSSLYYASSSEYYEKISFEFSAQATIKTPQGEYNIELKFSFSQEYYEKNETEIRIANENFKKPFEIELDSDDSSLKEMKYLHFIFASYKEEENDKFDIFEQLRELLTQRDKTILDSIEKNDEKKELAVNKLDNFKIWQESSQEDMSLVAIQKDGLGVFLSNSSQSSSSINFEANKNGFSFEASYSSSQTTYAEISKEIHA